MSNVEFMNPDNLPVEVLTLSVKNNGVVQQINALDSYWVEKRVFTLYERPPSGANLVIGAVDAWKMRMQQYLDDLKWLLSLEYHRFWSTILYHSSCMDSLVSFLQEADPPYLPPNEIKDIRILYEEIRKHLLIVFSRLITNKESKIHWMSKEYLADIIYNKFVFTIPIIWDLCLTYGADNMQHISRLVRSVFAVQQKYQADAAAAIAFVKEVFKYIILQVNKSYDTDDPPNLPETFKGFSEIRRPSTSTQKADKLTLPVLKDLIIHLLDTAMTIRVFVQAYPDCVDMLRKANFVISIVQLYEYGIPELYAKLQELGDETSIAYTEVEGYIDCARAELIDIFKEILAVYKNLIFSNEGNLATHIESYLSVMLEGLSERLLIKDYHWTCPVHEDIDMLRQAYPQIDTVKTDFILQAIYSNLDEPIPDSLLSTNNEVYTNGHIEIDNTSNTELSHNEIPDHIKEESLISEVRDILPHLGDGFILKCLQHYGFNAERVINSVLEDNLAETLRGLDRNLPIIPQDPVDTKYLETGIQRLNVFDGDQFDIMTRDDVDLSRIHVGKKKSKYKDLKAMLDDKTEVRQMKDIYMKYDVICDEENMYSDEYDDTYDAEDVTAHVEESSSEESEPEPEAAPPGPPGPSNRNRIDFCQNPEELRARRVASYAARRGRGGKPVVQNRPAPDVIGKPKGQGQEKEVLNNRDRKEKHKSTRGNHNRRQGAQWKRSQGMMPS